MTMTTILIYICKGSVIINNINDHQRTATLTAPTLNHTPATSLTTSYILVHKMNKSIKSTLLID